MTSVVTVSQLSGAPWLSAVETVMVCRSHSDPARRRPKPAIGICQPSEQMSAQHSPDHSAPQSGRIFRDFHWGGIRSAVCKIWKRGVHVRTCRCTPPLTCAKVIASWFINTSNLNAIGPTVMELSMVGCLRHPLTRHVSRAVAGTGGYRCRSNTKYIEW